MDDIFINGVEAQVLDFATDKRLVWEQRHQLYSVIFEVTPKCNFNCVHCYLHDHHCSDELTFEEIIRIIDILYQKEVLFLTFTGGEIFARQDFLDIYLYAKKKGFIIELYTNGSLINEEIVSVLKRYPPLLVDISLYGPDDDTYEKVTGARGAYTRVVKNIRLLLDAEIRVSVKVPVLNLYYHELPKMKALALELGIPFRAGFEIFPSIDNDDSVQQFCVPIEDSLKYEFGEFEEHPRTFGEGYDTELVDLKKHRPLFRCKLGRASCVIDYHGNMCPCMSFRYAGKRLTLDDFDEIWASFGQFQKMKASSGYKCLNCKAYDFCDICPAMMQFVHGDFEFVDEHFCRSAKARYAHYIQGLSLESLLDRSRLVEYDRRLD